ncbi:MAG: hypothetical protein AAGF01_23830, partial [Cyanobacteria bacterium P01_G01_bin.38]
VGKLAEVDWTSISDAGSERSREQLKQLEALTQQYRSAKVAQLESGRAAAEKGLKKGESSPVDKRISKLNERLDRQVKQVSKALEEFSTGSTVRIVRAGNEKAVDVFYGVVTDIEHKERPGSPSTPSSWHLKLALTNGEVKNLNVPVSAVNADSERSGSLRVDRVDADIWSGKPIYELFDTQQGDIRQERQMLTGNIVRAWDKFSAGKITNFTDHQGRIRQGVLLPKSFDMGVRLQNEPVVFKNSGQVREFIEEITEGRGSVKTMDSNLTIRKRDGEYILETPRSKAVGGKYYLDKDLIDRVGGDFLSSGESMRVAVPPERMENTLLYLMSSEKLACFDPNFLKKARDQMGIKMPEMEHAPEGGVLEVDDFVIDDNVVPYVEEPTAEDRQRLESLLEKTPEEPAPDESVNAPDQGATEPQSATPQEAEVPQSESGAVNAIQPPEKYPPLSKASVEKNIAKFLHEAGLAEQVMQGKSFHLKIKNEPYIPLVVESHEMGGGDRQLFLTHYREQNGDLINDGEMVFNLTKEGFLGLDQTAVADPFRGGEHRRYNGGDRPFARIFSKNILAQGFAEAAKQQMAQSEPPQPTAEQTLEQPSEQSSPVSLPNESSDFIEQGEQLRPLIEKFLDESGLTTLLENHNEPIDLSIENGDKAPLAISIDNTVSPTEINFSTALELPNGKRMGAFMEYLVGEDDLSLTVTSWGGVWDSGGGDPRFAKQFTQALFDQGFADAIENQLAGEQAPLMAEIDGAISDLGQGLERAKQLASEVQSMAEGLEQAADDLGDHTQPTVQSSSTPQSQPEVRPGPQPEPSSESQSNQDELLGTLRSWYRHARDIGRSPKHLERIAEIGKTVAAGQMDAYSSRAMTANQKDEAAWIGMIDKFVTQSAQILDRVGRPDASGAKVVEGQNFTLKIDSKSLSVSHRERGQILLIEDNQLQESSVTNVDLDTVERFALKLEQQPQKVSASAEYER